VTRKGSKRLRLGVAEMSTEARLARLERLQREERHRTSAEYLAAQAAERSRDGTASMAEYQLLYGQHVERWRDELAEGALELVTEARSRYAPRLSSREAIGWPPDVPLPSYVEVMIFLEHSEATELIPDERERKFRTPFGHPVLSASDYRQRAARRMLVLGDLHAMGLRRHVWRREGDRWLVLGSTVEATDDPAQVKPAPDRHGKTEGSPASWSEPVRSGQPPTDDVCNDLESGVHRSGCVADFGC
jgi:hypothetical protein